jgi:serine phosphatase RsbU (regulator of sigma subunit)
LAETGKISMLVSADAGALSSPARLAALEQVGLGPAADEGMERLARLVASMLQVPVALVSLVEQDRQVFPGMVGLAEPWATSRQTPLSHSMCQHVTATGHPLILPDAREDERTCNNLAIDDLGVIAYAGMPLTDGQGHVLGSLCAIDTRPRSWSAQELTDLADLAGACSADLRLRMVSGQAQVALERSKLTLRAAEDLADTSSLADVRMKVRDLLTGGLKPAYIGLALVDGEQLRRLPDPEISYVAEIIEPVFPLSSARPSAQAVRQAQIVVISDRVALERDFGPDTAAAFDAAGLKTAVCVPIPGTRRTLGTLILGWETPYQIDVSERAILATIAGYAGRAVERALYLDERITVARELQQAMLTDLPAAPGLQLAALYRPAARADLVGGDWYDAYSLASPPDDTDLPSPLAVTIGDITGHDVRAAAIMGQVRSMLRQADLDHQGLGPASAVTAMEDACHALSLDATGTLVHAHLHPLSTADGWQLTWTNAGHPPPLVVHPDGRVEHLNEHEMLLWPGMPDNRRVDRHTVLAPGATLLLYSDGLIEGRGTDTDGATDRAAAVLATAPADQPLPDLLQRLVAEVAGPSSRDDIALLAVRVCTG